jgi:hypothetical protein
MHIPPIVIFESLRIQESHKQNLPAGSTVQMTASVTLARLRFYNCYRILKTSRKRLHVLGGHNVLLLSGSFELLSET